MTKSWQAYAQHILDSDNLEPSELAVRAMLLKN
jgi:hypothetical protein